MRRSPPTWRPNRGRRCGAGASRWTSKCRFTTSSCGCGRQWRARASSPCACPLLSPSCWQGRAHSGRQAAGQTFQREFGHRLRRLVGAVARHAVDRLRGARLRLRPDALHMGDGVPVGGLGAPEPVAAAGLRGADVGDVVHPLHGVGGLRGARRHCAWRGAGMAALYEVARSVQSLRAALPRRADLLTMAADLDRARGRRSELLQRADRARPLVARADGLPRAGQAGRSARGADVDRHLRAAVGGGHLERFAAADLAPCARRCVGAQPAAHRHHGGAADDQSEADRALLLDGVAGLGRADRHSGSRGAQCLHAARDSARRPRADHRVGDGHRAERQRRARRAAQERFSSRLRAHLREGHAR